MGLTIDRDQFDTVEYQRFERRLDECLLALGRMLERPGFGAGPATIGAELELFLVDGQARPLRQPAPPATSVAQGEPHSTAAR